MKASEIAAEIMERRERTRSLGTKSFPPTVRRAIAARGAPEPLLDAKEMARHLGVCVPTLNKLVKAGLPFFTISGFTYCGKGIRRRFRVSEVEAWLRARQEPKSDTEAA